MRAERDDDVRELVEQGSSAWIGLSPLASQSRWAARAARRRVARATWLVAVGVGVTLVTIGLTLTATSEWSSGAASTMMHLVSSAFPGTPSPPDRSPAGAAPASASPVPAASARSAPQITRARPTPRSLPSPTWWSEWGGRHPSPSPSSPAPPSPSPSRSPDE